MGDRVVCPESDVDVTRLRPVSGLERAYIWNFLGLVATTNAVGDVGALVR